MADYESNVDALETTLGVLKTAGRLEDVDAALVALCRSMARLCDAQLVAGKPNSQMWRYYLDALEVLRGDDADDSDDIAELIADLRAAGDAGGVRP